MTNHLGQVCKITAMDVE